MWVDVHTMRWRKLSHEWWVTRSGALDCFLTSPFSTTTTGAGPWVKTTVRDFFPSFKGILATRSAMSAVDVSSQFCAFAKASASDSLPKRRSMYGKAAISGSLKNCRRKGAERFIVKQVPALSVCSATRMMAFGQTVRKKPWKRERKIASAWREWSGIKKSFGGGPLGLTNKVQVGN